MLGHWRGLLLAALEILLERMVCIWKAFLDEQLLEWSPAGVLGGHVARRLNQLNSCRVGPLRRPERATASQPALRRAGSSPPLQHGGRPACCTTRACWGSWAWPGRPAARRGGVQEVAVREEERPRRARQEVSERKASPDFSLFTLDRQNCCIRPHSVIRCLFFRFLSLTFKRHDTTRSIRVAYMHSPPSPLMQLHDTHLVVSYGGRF